VSLVHVVRREGVAVITLDRPPANAFTLDLIEELRGALSGSADSGAVVLASSSSAIFSAGWDLRFLLSQDQKAFESFVMAYCLLIREVFAFERPVIAALSGHAIAGGLILAAAVDERFAAEGRGELGLSEVLLGVPVPACALEIFRHAIGARATERLASTGENLSVGRAREVGLVDRVVAGESLLAEAEARARFLAGRPAAAHAAIKRRSRARALARFDQALLDDPFFDFWFSDDAQERIRALVAKLTKKTV